MDTNTKQQRELWSTLETLACFNQEDGFDRLSSFEEKMEEIRDHYPYVYVAIADKVRYEYMLDAQTKLISERISEALDDIGEDIWK